MDNNGMIAYKVARELLEEGTAEKTSFLPGHAERLSAVRDAIGPNINYKWKTFKEYAYLVMYSDRVMHDSRAVNLVESLINISLAGGSNTFEPGIVMETYNIILRINSTIMRQIRSSLNFGSGGDVPLDVQAVTIGLDETGKLFAHFHQPVVSYLSLLYWDKVREEDMRILLGFRKHHWEVDPEHPKGMIRIQGDLVIEVTRLNNRIPYNEFSGILYTMRWLPAIMNKFEDKARNYVRQNITDTLINLFIREDDADRLFYHSDQEAARYFRIIIHKILMGLHRAVEDILYELPEGCTDSSLLSRIIDMLYLGLNIYGDVFRLRDHLHSIPTWPRPYYRSGDFEREETAIYLDIVDVLITSISTYLIEYYSGHRSRERWTYDRRPTIRNILDFAIIRYILLDINYLIRLYFPGLYENLDVEGSSRRDENAPSGTREAGQRIAGARRALQARENPDPMINYIYGLENNYEKIIKILCPHCGSDLRALMGELARYYCYLVMGSEEPCRSALLGEKRVTVWVSNMSITIDYTIPYRLFTILLLSSVMLAGSQCRRIINNTRDEVYNVKIGDHKVEVVGGYPVRDTVLPLSLSRRWIRSAYRDLQDGRLHIAAAKLLTVKRGEPLFFLDRGSRLEFVHPEHESRILNVNRRSLVRLSLLPGIPYRVRDGRLYIGEVDQE